MLEKNTITKIALGVAAVAFIFSLITLIRAVIIGVGVLFAAIQVIGTLIIVAICAIMLYVLRTEEPEDEAEEDDAGEAEPEPYEDAQTDIDPIPESAVSQDKDGKYDFDNFE